MTMEKKGKVKKGCLAVMVGQEGDESGMQRFMIPIAYLHHPQFQQLLETAEEVYGFDTTGPLKLPCSVDDFLHLRWLIEREPQHDGHRHTITTTTTSLSRFKVANINT